MTHETTLAVSEQAPQNWEAIYARFGELGMNVDAGRRAEDLAHITGQGIMDVATRLHEVVVPGVEHTATDYTMSIAARDGTNKRPLMDPAERGPFFDHAAELVRKLATNKQPGEDEMFLKRVGNVVALSVVLAHPFADGNGRTARTMAHLIREGYDGTESAQHDFQIIGGNRPPSGFRINSYVPTRQGLEMSDMEKLDAAAGLDIPLAQHDAYNEAAQEVFTKPYVD